jgi:non-canonical (house-cleaning) NTP pyrophosphatase
MAVQDVPERCFRVRGTAVGSVQQKSKSDMKIALGSDRAAKINAVRDCAARISLIDSLWYGAQVIARPVRISAPAMPLNDEELMSGAKERAEAVRRTLTAELLDADLYVGLEGGFHTMVQDGERLTFLRGWAYATDGKRGFFGASPSINVPEALARRVIDDEVELGHVIDDIAGEHDVRSRQGAWGVFSRDLLTRSHSFEAALIAAFAPFYNVKLYNK